MFTFILFLILSGLSVIIYIYFSNQLVTQRKQILLLTTQNQELKNKLNKLRESQAYIKIKNETNTEDNKLQELTPLEDE